MVWIRSFTPGTDQPLNFRLMDLLYQKFKKHVDVLKTLTYLLKLGCGVQGSRCRIKKNQTARIKSYVPVPDIKYLLN
jgi:hypothetical protein